MADKITLLQEQLGKIIKGKKQITDKMLMAVLAKGHILLEDVPGVGKTTTALALSRLMGMDFNRIQFTPDVVPSDVTGFTMYDKASGQFLYRPGAVMCNMLLADEINRTSQLQYRKYHSQEDWEIWMEVPPAPALSHQSLAGNQRYLY